jgi:hypothetical protein
MPFDPTAARPAGVASDNPFYDVPWVCFINGNEVPVVGYETQSGVWQIPSFRIHLLPDPVIQRLGHEDRVPVQIFYLDHWASSEPTFRLLIDGEIVGWSFSNATGSRTMAFACLAHIHVFQQLYFFYMTNVDDIVASRSPEVISQGFRTPGLLYPYALFHQGLLTVKSQVDATTDVNDALGTADPADDVIKAPYELVYNVVKGTISELVPANRRSTPMMNFFARHIRKTRFHQRWVRLPILEDADALAEHRGVFPIFNAARNDQALVAMQRQVAAQVGSSGPVWNLLQNVLGLVYMEIGMLPNPACVLTTLQPLASNGQSLPQEGRILRALSDDEPLVSVRRTIQNEALRTQARELSTRIHAALDPPPPARTPQNPVPGTPLLQEIMQGLEGAYNEASRGGVPLGPTGRFRPIWDTIATTTETPASFAERAGSVMQRDNAAVVSAVGRQIDRYRAEFGTSTTREVVQLRMARQQEAALNQARQELANPTTTTQLRQDLVAAGFDEINPPASSEITEERIYQNLLAAARRDALAQGITDDAVVDPTTPVRLAQFFVKPNFFFGEIPACNAIFPSMVDAWTYDESYINQPTRIYINDSVMNRALRTTGANREFVLHALTVGYPDEADAVLHHKLGGDDASTPGATESGKNLLIWPEEFYKGPVTARSELPAWFQMLQQARNTDPNTATTAPRPDPVAAASSTAATNEQTTPLGAAALGTSPDEPVYTAAQPRRGRPDVPPSTNRAEEQPNWPHRWLPTTTQEGFSSSQRGLVYNSSPKFNDPAVARRYGSEHTYQQPIPPNLRRLAQHLRERFRQIRDAQFEGRHFTPPPDFNPDTHLDMHLAGRAVDLFITPLTGRDGRSHSDGLPDLEAATPVLDYILEHAAEFGVQYFIWSRTQWNGSNTDRRFSHYSRQGVRFDHTNHIHLEINSSAAAGVLSWYRDGILTGPATTIAAGPAPTQQTAGGTVAAETAGTDPREFSDDNPFTALFRLYAQSEFLKQRYQQRNANASMRFNPYLVAGFPAMLMDPMSTRMHVVGYLQSISHTGMLSRGGSAISTSAQFSFCRTIHEFIGDVVADQIRFRERVTSAPAEPVEEIRVAIQDERKAEELYGTLLYGRPRLDGSNRDLDTDHPAVFRWYDAFAKDDGTEQGLVHELTGESVADSSFRRNQQRAIDESTASSEATSNTAQTSKLEEPRATETLADAMARIFPAIEQAVVSVLALGQQTRARSMLQTSRRVFSGSLDDALNAARSNLANGFPGNRDVLEAFDNARRTAISQTTEAASSGSIAPTASNSAPTRSSSTTADQSATAGGVSSEGQQTAVSNLDPTAELIPNIHSPYVDAFASYHVAMQKAARPCCTLEQFIRFWHGGKTVGQLIADGDVEEIRTDFTYFYRNNSNDVVGTGAAGQAVRGTTERPTAVFYSRIFRLRPGPGRPPTEEERGFTSPPNIVPTQINRGLPADYAQTRADWDSVLIAYRERVRSRQAPNT